MINTFLHRGSIHALFTPSALPLIFAARAWAQAQARGRAGLAGPVSDAHFVIDAPAQVHATFAAIARETNCVALFLDNNFSNELRALVPSGREVTAPSPDDFELEGTWADDRRWTDVDAYHGSILNQLEETSCPPWKARDSRHCSRPARRSD
jgi:hypothetical protein